MSEDQDIDSTSETPDDEPDAVTAAAPIAEAKSKPPTDKDEPDVSREGAGEGPVATPESHPPEVPGRGLAVATLVIAAALAFLIGAALGKGFAPSQADAALARIDARDSARDEAHDDAYETAYNEAFAAEKKRGEFAGTRQGTIEGKRTGKAAATKRAPAAISTPEAVDCPSFDLDGMDYGSGAGYFDISVRGMQCQEAKNLILAAGFGGSFTGLQAHGWTCQNLGSEGETSQYRCTDSRNRVFRWWAGA